MWQKNLRILWFANWVTAVGMMAMVPFLTYFVEEIGIKDPESRNRWAGVLVGAAPIVAALMGPLWGGIGDRYGRRRMVLRALLAIVVFVGLMGFVRDPWTMLVLRILQGAFSGYVPPSITMISVQAPNDKQTYVAGKIQSTIPAGAVGGYILGGVLAHMGSIRLIFPVCSALALVGFLVALTSTEEQALETAKDGAVGRKSVFAKIGADYRYVLAMPTLVKLLIGLTVVRCSLSTADPNFAHFVEELGGDEFTAGLTMSLQSLLLLIMMPRWGRFSDEGSPALTLAICSVGTAVAFYGQALAGAVWQVIALRALTGFFLAGIFPAGYGLAARSTPPERRGSAIGVVFMALALSHALGSIVGGELLNLLGFRPLLATIATAALLLGGAAVLRLTQRREAA